MIPNNVEKKPLLSVLMPVYNSALYLKEAIDSILSQTFTDFEFLIFNDGSTDNSKAIIEEYTDHRIRFYDDASNQGYTGRLNEGIRMASGKYIARMDSDDIALPERFSKQVAFMEQHQDIAACGTFFEFTGTGYAPVRFNWAQFSDPDMLKINLLFDGTICHPTIMIRRSALSGDCAFYDKGYEPSEDFEMWVRMSRNHKLANIPEVLLKYRVNNNQVSENKNSLQRRNKFAVIKKQLADLKITPTDTELRIHDHLFFIAPILSADYLPKLKSWINKLIEANRHTATYNHEKFEAYLSDLYRQNDLAFKLKLKTLTPSQRATYLTKKVLGWKSIKQGPAGV